jgi:hypothetical protein
LEGRLFLNTKIKKPEISENSFIFDFFEDLNPSPNRAQPAQDLGSFGGKGKYLGKFVRQPRMKCHVGQLQFAN